MSSGGSDPEGTPEGLKDLLGATSSSAPTRKLAALYPGEKPQGSSVTALPEKILSSHQKPVDKKVACNECHVGIETSTGVDESLRLDRDACGKCHEERKASLACETCVGVTRDVEAIRRLAESHPDHDIRRRLGSRSRP